ncbi:MAG: DUF2007 domain-containing protein [Alphaproteobacteria bacterium]|tara:strand:+ start:380 stop:604 length:225 start_codon:yes stop_codon:yes gene_type:complete
MRVVLKSNDFVFISWVKNIFNSNSIKFYTLDEEMSTMEGNITAIPVRIMVDDSDFQKAKKILEIEKGIIESRHE